MAEDYPRTVLELEQRFSNEQACRRYLFALRWSKGFVCPRCSGNEAWETSRELWLCRTCRHQLSVTAGTLFHRSHQPLTLWFRVMWQVTSQKNGISAMGLQRHLHQHPISQTHPRKSVKGYDLEIYNGIRSLFS